MNLNTKRRLAAWFAWRVSLLAAFASASIALLVAPQSQALAQCAMCRTAAAAQGAQAAGTLNVAILILLFPALALFSAVFLLAFRCPEAPAPDKESDDLSG
jgi:hypothetical protein